MLGPMAAELVPSPVVSWTCALSSVYEKAERMWQQCSDRVMHYPAVGLFTWNAALDVLQCPESPIAQCLLCVPAAQFSHLPASPHMTAQQLWSWGLQVGGCEFKVLILGLDDGWRKVGGTRWYSKREKAYKWQQLLMSRSLTSSCNPEELREKLYVTNAGKSQKLELKNLSPPCRFHSLKTWDFSAVHYSARLLSECVQQYAR